jgi:putative copper export protein
MTVDWVSALVRVLSFLAMFQAAGVAIAIAMFGRRLEHASRPVRIVGFVSALAGILLVTVHYALEAARMSGSLTGMIDPSLQQIVFDSPMSTAAGARLLGLALIASVIRREGTGSVVLGLLGASCVVIAFTFVGHTADGSRTSWLSVLLALHLIVVAFWFGGLAPLHIIAGRESPHLAASIVAAFTRTASTVVPGLFLAGVLMTVLLVDRWSVFAEGYGLLLLAKAAGFAVLMVFAAMNKWRYGPAIANDGAGVSAFQRTVAIEYVLICAVLAATAIMTTFFSPSH